MILITGATGTVGSDLTKQLLQNAQPVRLMTRDAAKLSALEGKAEIIEGDLNDLQTIQAALKDIERVFLLTVNTQQDKDVLRIATEAGVKQVVKLSTLEAVDPRMAEHVRWHREREELIRSSGLAWTFLRPTMFMSTALDWAKTIRNEGAFYFPGGNGSVPVVDPWDVAAVAAAALTQSGHEGKAYSLTGPKALSFSEMAEILSSVLGRTIHYVDIPDKAAYEGMRAAGLPEYVIEALIGTFAVLRANIFNESTDDVEKVTGRAPRSFETWCRNHIDAFR